MRPTFSAAEAVFHLSKTSVAGLLADLPAAWSCKPHDNAVMCSMEQSTHAGKVVCHLLTAVIGVQAEAEPSQRQQAHGDLKRTAAALHQVRAAPDKLARLLWGVQCQPPTGDFCAGDTCQLTCSSSGLSELTCLLAASTTRPLVECCAPAGRTGVLAVNIPTQSCSPTLLPCRTGTTRRSAAGLQWPQGRIRRLLPQAPQQQQLVLSHQQRRQPSSRLLLRKRPSSCLTPRRRCAVYAPAFCRRHAESALCCLPRRSPFLHAESSRLHSWSDHGRALPSK